MSPSYDGKYDEDRLGTCRYESDKECEGCGNVGVWVVSLFSEGLGDKGNQFECTDCRETWTPDR